MTGYYPAGFIDVLLANRMREKRELTKDWFKNIKHWVGKTDFNNRKEDPSRTSLTY